MPNGIWECITIKMKGIIMRIGITISESKTQYYINQAYLDYIHESGMQAFMITKNHNIDLIKNMLDGIILPGGIDIDPIYYGNDNYTSYGTDLEKDNFERSVFHTFRMAKKPIFGICRGFQLIVREYMEVKTKLNDFLSFWPDIPHHNQVNEQQLDRTTYQHFVKCLPDLLYGKNSKVIVDMPVNSMHHQGLLVDFGNRQAIGTEGFRMAAWTTRGLKLKKDRKDTSPVICEAFRILDWGAPILAVQWHPEELKDIELLHNFFLNNGKKEKLPEDTQKGNLYLRGHNA